MIRSLRIVVTSKVKITFLTIVLALCSVLLTVMPPGARTANEIQKKRGELADAAFSDMGTNHDSPEARTQPAINTLNSLKHHGNDQVFSFLNHIAQDQETNVINTLSLSLNPTSVGTQQSVKVNSSSLNLTGSITIEAWIKPAISGVRQTIISRYQDQQLPPPTVEGGYLLHLTASNKLRFTIIRNSANGSSSTVDGVTDILPTNGFNGWHHVAGVYDDNTKQLRVYVDGNRDAPPKLSSGGGPAVASNPMRIGLDNNGLNIYRGLVDEVRITKGIVPAYAATATTYPLQTSLTVLSSPSTGLQTVGLWNFNNSTNLGADATGNAGNVDFLGTPPPVASTNVPVIGTPNQVPTANPGNGYNGTVNNPVQFNGSGSFDPDGTIVTYQWNFGDGVTGSGVAPMHAYTAAGNYTVSLVVTDNNGAFSPLATTNANIASVPPTNQMPQARPGGPYSGTVNIAVQFDGNSSFDPDGTIVNYQWNFGDGTPFGSGPTPQHTYSAPGPNNGSYPVILTVTDNSGAQASAQTTANISSGAPPAATGPVGYWKFDEGSGGTANDSSGNFNSGILTGGPTGPPTWSSGRVNSALSFDGVDDYVQVGNRSSLIVSTALTMSAWIMPTVNDAAGSHVILNKEGEYELGINNGEISWTIANNSPGWAGNWRTSHYAAPANVWTHVAVTYDSTMAGNNVKVYVNGLLQTSAAETGVIGDGYTPENDFRIGSRQCGICNEYFSGGIDEVRVYNRALSASEIQSLQSVPPPSTPTPTPTPTSTPTPPPPPPPPPSSTPTPPDLTVNQIGRLTSIGNNASAGNNSMRIYYAYDELGRSTGTVHKLDGISYVIRTDYDYPQNPGTIQGPGTVPVTQTFPDGERVDYTYDAGGAQQSIKTTPVNGSQQTIISSIIRNARGQTTQVVYGVNGAVSTHTYNEATNLFLNQLKTVIGGVTRQDYTYGFDSNGNVLSVTDNIEANHSLDATYTYDSLNQLYSMTANGVTVPYRYDSVNNLTNKENLAQSYGGSQTCGGCAPMRGPHALATSKNVIYNYDKNGNMISATDGTSITWNAENMPTHIVRGSVVMDKFYLGETLWKKVEGGHTTYYLPSARVEDGRFRKFFGSFAERSPNDGVAGSGNDGKLKFYHSDHLGSASLVTDESGAVIRKQTYMPFGEDRSVNPNSFTPKYQFNFKEKESTGFYDYGARLYNPVTGRWLSADTSVTDGLNRYAYVRNNPLRYVDPTGHDGTWAFYETKNSYVWKWFPNDRNVPRNWHLYNVPKNGAIIRDLVIGQVILLPGGRSRPVPGTAPWENANTNKQPEVQQVPLRYQPRYSMAASIFAGALSFSDTFDSSEENIRILEAARQSHPFASGVTALITNLILGHKISAQARGYSVLREFMQDDGRHEARDAVRWWFKEKAMEKGAERVVEGATEKIRQGGEEQPEKEPQE